jgi:Predicted GTPases
LKRITKLPVEYTNLIKERIAPFQDVPIVFASALTKQRIHKVLETVTEVYQNRKKKIATSKLNEFLQTALEIQQPPAYKGKYIKIKYVTNCHTTLVCIFLQPTPVYPRAIQALHGKQTTRNIQFLWSSVTNIL